MFFSEDAGLTGNPDQHGRFGIGDDIGQSDRYRPRAGPIRHGVGALRERPLKIEDTRHAFDEQTVPVDGVEAASRFGFGQARIDHDPQQQICDADPRRTRADNRDPLVADRLTGHLDRGEQGAGGYCGGALNIVIEGAEPVAVALQHASRIGAGEILPLQQCMRPAFQYSIHEAFDEIVVIPAAHPLVPPSNIDRVSETLPVVGPDIEQDRQGGGRMKTGAGGIERQFADRDAHAIGALVSEPEDALAIADDNRLHLVEPGMGQDFLDPVALRPAQKQATRIMPIMAEGLASLTDRRGVDEREHFFEVLGQHRIKERLVRILQSSQKDIAIEIAGELPHRLETPR